jgi:hypothetical protein
MENKMNRLIRNSDKGILALCILLLTASSVYGWGLNVGEDWTNSTKDFETTGDVTAADGIFSGEVDAGSHKYNQGDTNAVDTTIEAKLQAQVVSSSDYTSLALAISDIGATVTTLHICGTNSVADSTTITIPSTMTVDFTQCRGTIQGAAGGGTETLTINGGLVADSSQQIFGSNLTVNGSPKVGDIYPEWWAVNTAPGTTDMTAAVNAAITFSAISGGTVRLGATTYACNLTMKSNVILTGASRGTVLSPYTDTSPVITIDATGASFFTIKQLELVGTDDNAKTGQHGIFADPVGGGVSIDHFSIRNVRIFEMGGYGIRFESDSLSGPLVQEFDITQVQIRDTHKSTISFTGFTLDWLLESVHGQMINTDVAGTYPVVEVNGNGSTLAGGTINGCQFSKTGSASVPATGTGIYINDAQNIGIYNTSVENANPFIDIDGSLTQNVTIENMRANTPYDQTNMVDLGFARKVRIINSRFVSTGTATTGIEQTSVTMQNLRQLHIDALTLISGATTSVDIKRNKAIDTGKLYFYEEYMLADTEGSAATDDLDYIYGPGGTDITTDIPPRSTITIGPASTLRDIVIRHGVGNILLNGGSNISLLDVNDTIHLMWLEEISYWVEIGRELLADPLATNTVLYDFAVDGGTIGDKVLGQLPDNSTITEAWYEVITEFTSGGAATVAFGVDTDDAAGLKVATAFDNANYKIAGGSGPYWDFLPDGTAANFTTKTTASRDIIQTIAGAALTAGKVRLHYRFATGE